MNYFVYKTTTGKILMEGLGPLSGVDPSDFGPDMAAIAHDGTLSFEDAYVDGGLIFQRQPFSLQMTPTQIIADGIDECVIGNIPAGTAVQWPDGQTDEVTDGEVRFSVDLAGTYKLKFSAISYLDQEVTLEAVPAT